MFTSRAEIPVDLAGRQRRQRLTGKGIALGCVGRARSRATGAKMAALNAAKAMAKC